MRRILTILLVALLLSIVAIGQDRITVGEEVRYRCLCFGQEWVNATVENVSGGNVRVRFGNMDNQVVTLPENSPLIQRKPKPEDPNVVALRQSFANNVAAKYRHSVEQFSVWYDPQYKSTPGGPLRPAEWQKTMSDLAELDTLCKTQYRGVTNFTDPAYARPGSVDYRYAVWCEIAAKRREIEPIARAGIVRQVINLGYTEENLNFGFNEPNNPVRMETQQLIWERDKWRAEKIAWLKPKYAEYGIGVPADATSAAEKRADELKALVMRDAPNRSFKQPPWNDSAVESFVKAKFASLYPGSQVLKIGLDYKTWVKRESHTLVDSDEYFNYYKVSYNSYKRGSVLLKVPNRPFCQMQEFVVGQAGKGLVAAGIGGSGTFMKCE